MLRVDGSCSRERTQPSAPCRVGLAWETSADYPVNKGDVTPGLKRLRGTRPCAAAQGNRHRVDDRCTWRACIPSHENLRALRKV